MNKRRPRSDDVLFISAFAALLLGVALLLYTTRALNGVSLAWPFLIVAAGGVFLYLAIARRSSYSFLFAGLALVLDGSFVLACLILGWQFAKVWPLCMAIAGVASAISGMIVKKRPKVSFAVPSLSFVLLGLAFSAFSLGWVKESFKTFIVVWWPTLLIVGGISLFVAYGVSRRKGVSRGDSKKGAGKASAERPGRDRGPASGT